MSIVSGAGSDTPLRALLVVHRSDVGGTEVAFTRVLNELATRPELVVCIAYPEGGEFDTAWSEMAEHFSYRAGSLPVSWSFPGYLLWLFRRLRYGADFRRQSASFNPDVIVSFTSVLTPPVEIGHRLGIPVVVYVREYVEPQSVRRCLWRFLARRASALIAVSSALATDLEPYAPGRIRLVRDGVPLPDSPHRSAWPPADALFSFYGGFDENKGGELFVWAAACLHARRPGTRFRYYGVPWPGQEEYAHRIKSLVSESALPDDAFSFERTRNFADSFGEASAVVVPSRLEGFGLVALDSLAHGVPVIASRTGGLGDIVDDHVTGLLVPPGDIDALVSAMESLADDPAAVEAMGACGRRMVQSEFAVEPAVKGLIEVMHLASGAT